MTKIEELEQKLNELKYQIRNTVEGFEETCEEFEIEIHELKFEYQKALVELKESKKEGKWKPTYNEMYIYRTDFGDMRLCCWADSEVDEWRYNNMPIFKTNDEYKRYWHFMDTVKEKSYEFSKEDFRDDGFGKYYIYYDFEDDNFHVSSCCTTKCLGEPYFKTAEDAQYIIDNFKDELMEYWL